jgi:uncharacterized membrane protein YfcA
MAANSLSDFVTGQLRTYVPAAWGAVIAWLVGWQLLPVELAEAAQNFAVVLTAVATGIWYALWRAIEVHLPPWLTRLVLGSNNVPRYVDPDMPVIRPTIPRQGTLE